MARWSNNVITGTITDSEDAEMLNDKINELMNVIVDDSPENMPIRQKARDRLIELLYESGWIGKRISENGITRTKGGWNDMYNDCMQECCLVLYTKCIEYDPGKNTQPATYLTNVLSYAIQDFKKKAMNPGATEHYANLANRVRNALSGLKKEGILQPSAELVSVYTGLSIRQTEDALTVIRSGSGYDSFIMAPDTFRPGVHDDSSARPVAVGSTSSMRDPADFVIEDFERRAVQEELKKIGGPEMEAFLMYYGYDGYEDAGCKYSYQGVARAIGNVSSKEAKKMIEGVRRQLIKNLVFRKLYGADDT